MLLHALSEEISGFWRSKQSAIGPSMISANHAIINKQPLIDGNHEVNKTSSFLFARIRQQEGSGIKLGFYKVDDDGGPGFHS